MWRRGIIAWGAGFDYWGIEEMRLVLARRLRPFRLLNQMDPIIIGRDILVAIAITLR
jgi:hypothetical protein